MNEREIIGELALVRSEVKVQEAAKEEQTRWIEDEVEELERWDGLE